MDPKKVYKDIVYLLYNVLDNEKLRYELYKDENYRGLYIKLVDDLLTLEKNDDCTFDDLSWAAAFGKAIVVIAQANQRFEKQAKTNVDKIYEDYSKMIAQSNNAFEVKRATLTNDKIKFTQQDVAYNGKLDDQTIKKYDDLAKADMEAKAQADAQENMFVNDEKDKVHPENEQANNQQQWNPFMGNPNGQQFTGEIPPSPMQDPRFYPYTKKPKFMPWFKIALGVIVIIAAILLIAANSFVLAQNVNLASGDTAINATISGWALNGTVNGHAEITTVGGYVNYALNGNLSITGTSKNAAMNIIAYIFYCIPAVYVGWSVFRKPRSLADKYRVSYWPIIFMIVFFALSIIDTYQFAAVSEVKTQWEKFFSQLVDKSKIADYNSIVDDWVDSISDSIHLTSVTILMDVAIGFLGISVIAGIVICFFNPRLDKMKYQKAMNEYQRAMMSAMQGIPYTMDQSLFEDDSDVIIHNKSKFTIWLEKTWNKIAFWKHKKNNKKDK